MAAPRREAVRAVRPTPLALVAVGPPAVKPAPRPRPEVRPLPRRPALLAETRGEVAVLRVVGVRPGNAP